jgi:hypothetical protein
LFARNSRGRSTPVLVRDASTIGRNAMHMYCRSVNGTVLDERYRDRWLLGSQLLLAPAKKESLGSPDRSVGPPRYPGRRRDLLPGAPGAVAAGHGVTIHRLRHRGVGLRTRSERPSQSPLLLTHPQLVVASFASPAASYSLPSARGFAARLAPRRGLRQAAAPDKKSGLSRVLAPTHWFRSGVAAPGRL